MPVTQEFIESLMKQKRCHLMMAIMNKGYVRLPSCFVGLMKR